METAADPITRYLNNIERLRAFDNASFDADLPGGEILQKLLAMREEALAIRQENVRLLSDPALGFGLAPEQMHPEQAEMLQDFAVHLARFSIHKDLGLFYDIHRQLLAYAEWKQDPDLTVMEHYYCGLALFYLRNPYESLHMDTYEDELLAHFRANAALLPKIGAVANQDTQFFIMRSVGNVRLGYSLYERDSEEQGSFFLFQPRLGDVERYLEQQQEDIRVFFDPKLQEQMPYLPWDTMRYALSTGCMTLFSYLRNHDDEQVAQFVYERALYIEKHLEQTENTRDRYVKPRIVYYISAAKFHAGKISIDQLLETFFRTLEQADPKDYSLDGTYLNLDLGNYALADWGSYSREEKWRPHLDAIRQHANAYIRSMPNSDSSQLVAQYLIHQMNLNYSLHLHSDAGYMLQNLMVLDKPSYVHSYIVSELARVLGSWLYEHDPDIFEDLKACLREHDQPDTAPFLLEMIRMSGLYSNVGMLSILPVARMKARPLTAEEDRMMQLHAYAGYITLCLHPDTVIYAPAALGHHCWYNGRGGYPEYYDRTKQKAALAVDIVAAASYLEQSTDAIGICLEEPVSTAQAFAEIRSGAGTRFLPQLAAAMEDENLKERLNTILGRGRQAAYIRLYRRREAQEN